MGTFIRHKDPCSQGWERREREVLRQERGRHRHKIERTKPTISGYLLIVSIVEVILTNVVCSITCYGHVSRDARKAKVENMLKLKHVRKYPEP